MNAATNWFAPQQQMNFNDPRGAVPTYASGTLGSGTAGVFGGPGTGGSFDFSKNWQTYDPATVPDIGANLGRGANRVNPSLFGDAGWQGTLNADGSYTPGKFDTLASYGGIAKDAFGLWNQYQAGKTAKANLDLNKQSLAFQKNVTGAKFEEAARGRHAQLLANSGNYSGLAAYDAAGPVAKARRVELGLA